jgi:MOSC domain-containing protein YiiM
MFEGHIVAIHLGAKAREPLQAVKSILAVAGHGLEGDRYFQKIGTFSSKAGPDREVTLIATEALEALQREFGISLSAGESRRNLATRGVPLNDLVGQTFRVGEVVLEGLRLCEPCSHLAELTYPQVLPGLKGRGGLRARVVVGGEIQIGNAIMPQTAGADGH